ncbi:MAG TPA: glutamate formimidoyltransferase [Gemmatimonadaceae bacterium]|nr:glutamate formimidoyltransferase [Gemmatimonadaceae bacterium]
MSLVECVPNFSEGRRPEVIAAIRNAIADTSGVRLLDVSADPWHNRSVMTFVAPPEAAVAGAFAGIRAARDLIDLTRHGGVHPRMGAADVVPFVPLEGCTLEDCAELARQLGERVGNELHVPVYLYAHAANWPARRDLADVRRGGFERMRTEVGTAPERAPDFGPHRIHPTAGAVAIGARQILVAYNVYLGPASNLPVARDIARAVRDSSGGLPGVKALAFEVNEQAQVSMNLVDLEHTGLADVYDAIEREAAERGVEPTWSEIVGLVPERALWDAGAAALRLRGFSPAHVLEHRLRETAANQDLETLLDRVAAPTSAPGGGAVAAYAGALAAALVAMVAGVASRRGLGGESALEPALTRLRALAQELLRLADDDAEAYARYARARTSQSGVQAALLEAARVPVRIARAARIAAREAAELARTGLPAAAADAATAALLAHAVCASMALTVRVNVAGLADRAAGAPLVAEAEAQSRAAGDDATQAVNAATPADA